MRVGRDRSWLGFGLWALETGLESGWQMTDGVGSKVGTSAGWLQAGEVCDGCLALAQPEIRLGRRLPVLSLSAGQPDQVPACSLALVSCWRERT